MHREQEGPPGPGICVGATETLESLVSWDPLGMDMSVRSTSPPVLPPGGGSCTCPSLVQRGHDSRALLLRYQEKGEAAEQEQPVGRLWSI